MQAPIKLGPLASDPDWEALAKLIEPPNDVAVLKNVIATFRALGARAFLFEGAYIDRDFSAAFSAFYASLFRPYLKYCKRIHFLACEAAALTESPTAEDVARALEGQSENYLGHIVLRPLTHAPVGSAIVSTRHLAKHELRQCDIRADYEVHVLGADLRFEGVALTQQDHRVGACAQAAIWMVGRHFHRRHGGPWFSLPDINEVALKPTDDVITRSLPAGSEFLRPDNIVRALRAMDRHPVVYTARIENEALVWARPAHEIVNRYVDSGIPVILGLRPRDGAQVGHAVVVVGREIRAALPDGEKDRPTWADMTTHFLVNDDQRGSHCRLPVAETDRRDDYPWTIESDATYAIVPLPAKVFMTADVAEKLAREYIATVIADRQKYVERARRNEENAKFDPDLEKLDPSFFAMAPQQLAARTYLTFGWKYKRRALRNRLPDQFKSELLMKQFPRYVWVTEFSLPGDFNGANICNGKVRAHVVVDATGSQFWESVLVLQIPGLSIFWTFNPEAPTATRGLILRQADRAEPFYPKARGWEDFDACDIPQPQS